MVIGKFSVIKENLINISTKKERKLALFRENLVNRYNSHYTIQIIDLFSKQH